MMKQKMKSLKNFVECVRHWNWELGSGTIWAPPLKLSSALGVGSKTTEDGKDIAMRMEPTCTEMKNIIYVKH